MPEFHLDTSGAVSVDSRVSQGRLPGTPYPFVITGWHHLDPFTQGYIEALFFTESSPAWDKAAIEADRAGWEEAEREGQSDGALPGDSGFADLAPETLARIIADCAAFQERAAGLLALAYGETMPARTFGDGTLPGSHRPAWDYDAEAAGRDFWFTRNGHGVGFWDREALNGDAPDALQIPNPDHKPYRTTSIGDNLSNLCGWRSAFGEVNAYLGDDGRVYL